MLESFFNKAAGLKALNLNFIKMRLFSCKVCEFFSKRLLLQNTSGGWFWRRVIKLKKRTIKERRNTKPSQGKENIVVA